MARRRRRAASEHSADRALGANEALPLLRVPLALARHFIQICTAASAELVAEEGLISGQFAVLAHIGREAGIDQSSLAARMGVDRARVSQLADELDAMGLIDRRVNGADRRARALYLTARGEELRTRLQPAVRAAQMRILAPLSPREREHLLDLLVRVIQANRALARPGESQKRRARQSPSEAKNHRSLSART